MNQETFNSVYNLLGTAVTETELADLKHILDVDSKTQVVELLNRITELEAQNKEMLGKAFDAGVAYALASHKDFKQIHPNKQQFLAALSGGEEGR